MLSEDEKKLLKIFKAEVEKEESEYFSVNAYTQLLYDSHKTVLNIITKLQKENEYMHQELDKQQITINNYTKENEEKDRQIDLMAEEIKERKYNFTNKTKKDIKQYFERKARDGRN